MIAKFDRGYYFCIIIKKIEKSAMYKKEYMVKIMKVRLRIFSPVASDMAQKGTKVGSAKKVDRFLK